MSVSPGQHHVDGTCQAPTFEFDFSRGLRGHLLDPCRPKVGEEPDQGPLQGGGDALVVHATPCLEQHGTFVLDE